MKDRILTVDDGDEILSKFLAILDQEAERILKMSPEIRKSADIKTAIAAATFLNQMNKGAQIEEQKIRSEVKSKMAGSYRTLSQTAIQNIIDNRR